MQTGYYSLDSFAALLEPEMKRLDKLAAHFQNWLLMIRTFENHFNCKYTHGDNVIYDLARVNVLRAQRNEDKLI